MYHMKLMMNVAPTTNAATIIPITALSWLTDDDPSVSLPPLASERVTLRLGDGLTERTAGSGVIDIVGVSVGVTVADTDVLDDVESEVELVTLVLAVCDELTLFEPAFEALTLTLAV